jgi:membrane-anchored protein YejM (alkaline phosphatase superfamily)
MRWLFRRGGKVPPPQIDDDFLLVTWDSCRYDTYVEASTPVLDRFGPARRAWAMGTYTLPAHAAMFYGFLPHAFVPEPLYNRYQQQLFRISHRNVHVPPVVTFPTGGGNIVTGLRRLGYFTVGVAAMDWFRDAPELRAGFREFRVTGIAARRQNQTIMEWIARQPPDRPCFAFVNYGETHSPFRHEGMNEPATDVDVRFGLPMLLNQSGLHSDSWTFDRSAYLRQVACASFLDERTGELVEMFRRRGRRTTVVVCGDHGECFGEDGLYGHAFYHERVMEVPLLIFRMDGTS